MVPPMMMIHTSLSSTPPDAQRQTVSKWGTDTSGFGCRNIRIRFTPMIEKNLDHKVFFPLVRHS